MNAPLETVEISLTALAKELKLDKGPTSHRVRKAIDRGFLINHEEKRGKPARLAIGDPFRTRFRSCRKWAL